LIFEDHFVLFEKGYKIMSENILKRNNVKVIGKGDQPMLFIHGFGCDQNMWRFITPAFEERYKIILIDLVGCGKSDDSAYDPEKYDTLQGHVNDVLEICSLLALKNIILVGHSISANISLLSSISNNKIFEKLIFVCPSPKFLNEDGYTGGFDQKDIDGLIDAIESNYLGWSKAIAPVIMSNVERPELSNELEESFCSNNPEIAIHFAKVTFLCDNRNDLAKVKTKTLVLQSKTDNLAAVSVGEYVHDNIKNSVFKVLETNGHCPHLSHPNETILAIKEFLS
jgi:sigma-B regulation protein RsbQ